MGGEWEWHIFILLLTTCVFVTTRQIKKTKKIGGNNVPLRWSELMSKERERTAAELRLFQLFHQLGLSWVVITAGLSFPSHNLIVPSFFFCSKWPRRNWGGGGKISQVHLTSDRHGKSLDLWNGNYISNRSCFSVALQLWRKNAEPCDSCYTVPVST